MVKFQTMLIEHAGSSVVFFLLFCSLLGSALEDETVISGFNHNTPDEPDQNWVEVLAFNCRLELIYLRQIYEGLSIPDPSTTSTGNVPNDQASTLENVKKTLRVLHPRIREDLFKCLRENYLILPASVKDVSTDIWYQNHVKPPFAKANTVADSRRHLDVRAVSKGKAPPNSDEIQIPVTDGKEGAADSESTKSSTNHTTTIIITVAVTAVVTFLIATIVILCCCRQYIAGGSGFDKDDRPLLSLSMNDYSVGGSSPNTWPSDNSVHKEKLNSQSFASNLSGKNETVSLDRKLSTESDVALNVAPSESSADSMSSSTNAILPLKPPPGRLSVSSSSSGLPPLKPPPGRVIPPPEPPPPAPASAPPPPPSPAPPPPPPSAAAPPPPPPPKAPGAPPPPPLKRSGPPPPGPPPPPGKGPRAPAPPKGGGPPLPRPISVKAKVDDSASKAKLKPFFWDKVMASPEHSMVWHEIKSGSFQFNEEMIESLFGYNPNAKQNEKKKDSFARDPPTQYIQLVDQKKAQNLSILLRALNVTSEEVRDALLEGNELPAELLETLIKMAPTPEEELKLRLFNGEMSQLGPAERFLKILVDIPFAFRRLEALLFMITMQEDVSTVKEAYITLEAACKELKSSRLFLKLLEAVLKTGNRMNDGTYRGGAQAFKLDTLLKLADVKGTDGKTTLLHFVVQEIIRSEGIRAVRAARESISMSSIKSEDLQLEETPDDSEEHYRNLGLQVVSGLGDQLENVRKAACIDSETMTGAIGKLGTSLVKNRNFLNKEMKDVEEENGFLQALRCFIQDAEGEITWLLEEEKRIMGLVKNTVDYFHGNSGKEDGLRLFVVVRDFLIMLEKVCKEVKDRPRWPTKPQRKDPPSRQSSTETPRTPMTPDIRQKLFPAIQGRRNDDGSSSDSD